MLTTKIFKKKQFVFKEGDRAEEMYIIKSGKIRIMANVMGKNVVVGRLGKNSFFGEVALLRNARHSATAVAEEDAELAVITKDMLEQHLIQLPQWLQTVIRSLAHRLNDTMQRIEHPPKEDILKKTIKKDTGETAAVTEETNAATKSSGDEEDDMETEPESSENGGSSGGQN